MSRRSIAIAHEYCSDCGARIVGDTCESLAAARQRAQTQPIGEWAIQCLSAHRVPRLRTNKTPPARPPVVLASGLVCRHRRMANGAQEIITDRSPDYLTHEEWDEYCAIIAPKQASQVAKNWVAFYGMEEAQRRAYATTRKDRPLILATLRAMETT